MDCEPKIIANSEIGHITLCNCGVVTIFCGNAAIRLPKESFSTFSFMIDSAFANFAKNECTDPPDSKNSMHNMFPGKGPFCG
jgi:hypothetical protein